MSVEAVEGLLATSVHWLCSHVNFSSKQYINFYSTVALHAISIRLV